MGQSKSKAQQYPHFLPPPGYPPYGQAYPYAPPPPAPVGYGPGFNGPGFVPPGFGPQMTMPQPAVPWPPPERRRRRTREKSNKTMGSNSNTQGTSQHMVDNLPPGFIPTSMAQNQNAAQASAPVIPGNFNPTAGAAANQQPPPLFTPGAAGDIPLTSFPSPRVTTQQAPAGPQRRAATPFIQPFPQIDASADDEGGNTQPQRQTSTSHRQSQSRSHRRTASAPQPPTIPQQVDPFLPQPPPNPLPQPPRDLYQLSPYKTLLNLPQTMTLLTATTGAGTGTTVNPNVTVVRSNTTAGMAGVGSGFNPLLRKKTKSRKGFFSFGHRHQEQEDETPAQAQQSTYGNIHFVPVPVYHQDRPSDGMDSHRSGQPTGAAGVGVVGGDRPSQAPVPPVPTPPSPPPQRSPPHSPPPDVQRSSSPVSHHSHHTHTRSASHQSHPSQHQLHVPPQQQQQQQQSHQPFVSGGVGVGGSGGSGGLAGHQRQQQQHQNLLEFDQSTHPGFLNHSPHRVLYANRTYPTATHLHEALKFIETRPDFAERIRQCQSVQEVYPLSAGLQVWVRPDWATVFLNKMEETLWYKFRQHPELRSLLMGTGDTELIYADPNDGYWGSGAAIGGAMEGRGAGSNQLGKLLVKVRERLRVEGLP